MVFDESRDALSPPQIPAWKVIQFIFSNRDTDAKLVVMCNNKCFVIRLSDDSFSKAPKLKDRYLFFLKVAEEFELDGVTI